jgi:DNA-binding response OmpR family regulator
MHSSYILIVSNETHSAQWQSTLVVQGDVILVYPDCQDAKALVAEGRVKLVIVAVDELPEVELAICNQLLAQVSCPLLLLTPFENEDYFVEAYKQGVSECILQPISASLLLAKAASWLRWSYIPEESFPGRTEKKAPHLPV